MITLASGVYHLLSMRHVHIEDKIMFSVSRCLLTYFIKIPFHFFYTAYFNVNFCEHLIFGSLLKHTNSEMRKSLIFILIFCKFFLIWNFRRFVNVEFFLSGESQASEF